MSFNNQSNNQNNNPYFGLVPTMTGNSNAQADMYSAGGGGGGGQPHQYMQVPPQQQSSAGFNYALLGQAQQPQKMSGSSSMNSAGVGVGSGGQKNYIEDEVFNLISQILNPSTRETALLDLSKRRESLEDLAPILWHTFGMMAVLMQEVVAIYPLLANGALSTAISNRVCNALALLQCVASHPETRVPFLNGLS
eukprot:Partr_v1_DN25442_c0_g1_i3_m53688 putative cell differentiation protein Rcd1